MIWNRLENETVDEYVYRLGCAKEVEGFTWEDIRVVVNRELNTNY